MRLFAVGFWRGFDNEPGLPVPQEFEDPGWRASDRERIAAYLDAGHTVCAYAGLSWCRFACGCEEMGCQDLTDGRWVWPEGLSHYVRDHALKLPDELVSRGEKNDWQPDAFQPPEDPAALAYDVSFWLDWCAANTSGDPAATRLEFVLPGTEPDAVEARIDALRTKRGESDVPCQFGGCEEPALAGGVFCARCAHLKMGVQP